MTRLMIQSALYGALAASAALNVYQARLTPPAPPAVVTPTSPEQESPKCCAIMASVDLTPQQRRQLSAGCPDYVQTCVRLDQRVGVLVAELEEALLDEKAGAERIEELVDSIGDLQAEQLMSRVRGVVMVRKTLTPCQLERLADCCGQ